MALAAGRAARILSGALTDRKAETCRPQNIAGWSQHAMLPDDGRQFEL